MINWISWTNKSWLFASHDDLALSTFNHNTAPVNICQQDAIHINLHTDILWHTKDIATQNICSETFRYTVVSKCMIVQITWHPHISKIGRWMCVHVLEWEIKYMKILPLLVSFTHAEKLLKYITRHGELLPTAWTLRWFSRLKNGQTSVENTQISFNKHRVCADTSLELWWYWASCVYSCFIPLLIDRYYDRLLPFFRQLLLIPNRNYKFMNHLKV